MTESFTSRYFVKNLTKESGTCQICYCEIKCRGWSTSGFIRHLWKKHNITKDETKSSPENSVASGNKKPSTKINFKAGHQESCEEIVSKLAAVDGISINSITKSEFIRKSLQDRGHILPKSPKSVMYLIHLHYTQIKECLISEIVRKISNGERFSLSLDEYTSSSNGRYLNVNVHENGGNVWNLGVVSAGFSPETAIEGVRKKLEEFRISPRKHIVACVTHGGDTMLSLGKLIECEHQLCYAFGVNLAVCDVLYNKVKTESRISTEETENNTNDETDDENEDFSQSVDLENENPHEFDISIELDNKGVNVSHLIEKVRKISKIFHNSSLKNNILQKYAQEEHGRSLNLLPDCKTRWDSLLEMLQRFIQIRSSVTKALIDCREDIENLHLEEEEISIICDMVASLEAIQVGVEKLCNRGSNLLTAESVLSFVMKQLDEQNTLFSKKLKEAFIGRVVGTRNEKLTSLMQYLSLGKNYRKFALSNKAAPGKTALRNLAKRMFVRLYGTGSPSTETGDDFEKVPLPESHPMSLAEKLEEAIKESEREMEKKKQNCRDVKNELEIFEITGEKPQNLTLLFGALKTIPPASVESEKAFSTPGLFFSKIRTKLNDQRLLALCENSVGTVTEVPNRQVVEKYLCAFSFRTLFIRRNEFVYITEEKQWRSSAAVILAAKRFLREQGYTRNFCRVSCDQLETIKDKNPTAVD